MLQNTASVFLLSHINKGEVNFVLFDHIKAQGEPDCCQLYLTQWKDDIGIHKSVQ